jgi:hypothetical protein
VPLIALALVLLMPLLFVVMLPFSIVQRYRVGTARRPGRSWVATANVLLIGFSIVLYLVANSAMAVWVPKVIPFALLGLVAGGMLGLLGLKLTRWETSARELHYTPNRLLVLMITVIVAARILYGFWRAWNAWHQGSAAGHWLTNAYLPGSVAVGGIVLGYYVVFWIGVGVRISRHRIWNR